MQSVSYGHRYGLILTAAALLAGCTDREVTPLAPPDAPLLSTASLDDGGNSPAFVIEPRFDLDLDVEGSLKPGLPIHLTVRGQANFATQDAEIRLVLPEVAAANRSSWDVVEVPVGEEVDAVYHTRRSFAAGERFRERVSVTIPEPGYYYVSVVALQHSDDAATDGGRYVGTGASRELWLWIDEHGGRVTERFDPSVFSEGTRRVRGPRGSERTPPRIHDKGSHLTCSVYPDSTITIQYLCPGADWGGPPPPPPAPVNATAAATVTYFDQGTSVTRPLPNAWLAWKVVNTVTNALESSGGAYTTASGASQLIDCAGPTSERRLELAVYTESQKAEVKNYTTIIPLNGDRTIAGQYYGACGGSIAVTADNPQAHLFINLGKNWDGHARVFGINPPVPIRAGLYPLSVYGTRYDWGASDVHIEPKFDNIWGEFGVFVPAHEWAHLWQDKYLYQLPATNGLRRFTDNTCPHEHFIGQATNFGCAFGEAFADWYAVLIRESDVPTWRRDLEESTYHLLRCTQACTDDGSIVQGAIHAFLWDITDVSFTEAFDLVQKRPIDVIYAIKGCEVSIDWREYKPYTGIDHLIWCMEHRFPYQVRVQTATGERLMDFFNTRPVAARPVIARGPMVDGFSDNFRRLWLVDLYSKRSGIGQTPVFHTILPGEDPSIEPQEPPAEPACTPTGTELVCQ